MRPRLRSWRHVFQPFQPHEAFQAELRHKDLHTYAHAHVFVFSPQPAASFRDKTCLVNSILMWIICCTAGYSDSLREGNHTATVTETCSRVPITQQGQSGHVRSRTAPPDRAKKKWLHGTVRRHEATTRRDLLISYGNALVVCLRGALPAGINLDWRTKDLLALREVNLTSRSRRFGTWSPNGFLRLHFNDTLSQPQNVKSK